MIIESKVVGKTFNPHEFIYNPIYSIDGSAYKNNYEITERKEEHMIHVQTNENAIINDIHVSKEIFYSLERYDLVDLICISENKNSIIVSEVRKK